jgi:hypothetical protein
LLENYSQKLMQRAFASLKYSLQNKNQRSIMLSRTMRIIQKHSKQSMARAFGIFKGLLTLSKAEDYQRVLAIKHCKGRALRRLFVTWKHLHRARKAALTKAGKLHRLFLIRKFFAGLARRIDLQVRLSILIVRIENVQATVRFYRCGISCLLESSKPHQRTG